MKTRVLSSLVGLVILAVVFVFIDTLVLNAIMGLISILAVIELLGATGVRKFRSLTVLSVILAAIIPFARWQFVRGYLFEIIFIVILLFFVVLLKNHAVMQVEQVAMAFFFSMFVPVFFSCAVYIRDDFGPVLGGFYLLVSLGAAWLSDTGAYFTGLRFGKHKLAPTVSPKKTVEGFVGGIVVGCLCMLLLAWGYSALMATLGRPLQVHYLRLALVMPLFSVIGVLGDLSASIIKRRFGVKDFGHIMPGHGGIMDRFDSVLFTMPSVYILIHHITLVTNMASL